MRTFHANWYLVAIVANGVVGLWGLGLAVARRPPGQWFAAAKWAAITAILVQVAAGLWLFGQGARPGNEFHTFYGVVIVFTFGFAYIYRAQLARRPALAYGLLLLFVMGLGIRAWTNVS